MFKNIDFTQLGGLYVYQNTLDYLQTAYAGVLDAIADSYGDLVIVSGCVQTNNTISDGWVVYNKQLYPFVGATIQTNVYEDVLPQSEQFADGSTKNVYSTKRLAFTNQSTGIEWADITRLPFATTSLLDAFTNVQTLLSGMVWNEPVILSGCTIDSGVITAGKVYIDGKVLSVPQYSGATPVYLNNNGIYTTVQPVVGHYILFDGGTSQYYADVVRRNTSYSGQVFTHTNATELNYFDAGTGLGKWRWKGFKLSTVLRSRVPIGYDARTSSGGDSAWDSAYNTVANPIGNKSQNLAANQIPELTGEAHTEINGTDGTTNNGKPIYNGDGEGHGNQWTADVVRINHGNTQVAVDMRQASVVVIQIEKI